MANKVDETCVNLVLVIEHWKLNLLLVAEWTVRHYKRSLIVQTDSESRFNFRLQTVLRLEELNWHWFPRNRTFNCTNMLYINGIFHLYFFISRTHQTYNLQELVPELISFLTHEWRDLMFRDCHLVDYRIKVEIVQPWWWLLISVVIYYSALKNTCWAC